MRQRNINIDFLLAGCDSVSKQGFLVPAGQKISDVMPLLNKELMMAVKETGAISINGECVSEEQILDADTRIIILKKLINDPKDLRRQRAKLAPIKKVKK
ncbi:MAG: hypothetical protein VXA09_06955 [Burkholderiaceae bacterium]